MHIKYCAAFGLSQSDLEASEELPACTAYTRYVLDIGQSQDYIALLVALTPCIIGYQTIARQLVASPTLKRGGDNPYWEWIEMYMGEEYAEAVTGSLGKLTPTLGEMGVRCEVWGKMLISVDSYARTTCRKTIA